MNLMQQVAALHAAPTETALKAEYEAACDRFTGDDAALWSIREATCARRGVLDPEWMEKVYATDFDDDDDAFTTRTDDALVLAKLVEADGAILGWQAEPHASFVSAYKRGVIRFHEDSDCFVHPDAVRCVGGGYSMNQADRAGPEDDAPSDRCTNPGGHRFECTGTAYGGDDTRYHGEGRSLCVHCGADGDA